MERESPKSASTPTGAVFLSYGVARELQISVSDYFGPGSATKSAEAYDLYLRGIRDVDTHNKEAALPAIAAFSRAVEHDPAYVNAWVGLATAYDAAATLGASPRRPPALSSGRL